MPGRLSAWEAARASQENALSPAVGSDTESFPRAQEGFFRLFPPHSGVWELHPPLTEGYGQSAQHAFWFPREIILLLLHMAKTISESQLREVLS